MLICPVRDCRLPLLRETKRFVCPQNHSFDVARRGYVNLLQPQDKKSKQPGDSAEALMARERLQARMTAPSLSEAFFALLRRRGFDTPAVDAPRDAKERRSNYGKRQRALVEVLTHHEEFYKEYQLAEMLLEHDEYFSLWRSHHIKMVERMVGAKPGTGGSEGVGYLRKTLDKRFFPELWEARTYLSANHDPKGCPFAKP